MTVLTLKQVPWEQTMTHLSSPPVMKFDSLMSATVSIRLQHNTQWPSGQEKHHLSYKKHKQVVPFFPFLFLHHSTGNKTAWCLNIACGSSTCVTFLILDTTPTPTHPKKQPQIKKIKKTLKFDNILCMELTKWFSTAKAGFSSRNLPL